LGNEKTETGEEQVWTMREVKKLCCMAIALLAPTDTSRGGASWHRVRQGKERKPGGLENLLAVLFWWLVSVGVALLLARQC
jgi:hypothetical protein